MGSLIGWGRGRSVVSGHRPSSQRGQGDLEALETQLLKDSPCCYLLRHLQQICECLKFTGWPFEFMSDPSPAFIVSEALRLVHAI